ncbi:HAD family hydrolase [Bacillus salacetis]|uniref:HAD family hydrolase n=1 Tax=Bacillus salacetis TaxID=2315464 RepID=A0A3A1R5A2_9BACI|nr:HAD family hydrolase [Bacillus salacetis]RIW38339.1 HAD family hydrolase [Bacillus salacetis]
MNRYKAILFDLDDTLLNRDHAVDELFLKVLAECYMDVNQSLKENMNEKFKDFDRRAYGDNDKTKVLAPLFEEFPPRKRLTESGIQEFWNHHFPLCFTIEAELLDVIRTLKEKVKVAIITNGSTARQKAKVKNTKLDDIFEVIIISEEAGCRKPDERIFKLALDRLNVQPEDTLLVGDDLQKDISGCQNVNIKGVWFNPYRIENNTEIQPFAEIQSLSELFSIIEANT